MCAEGSDVVVAGVSFKHFISVSSGRCCRG